MMRKDSMAWMTRWMICKICAVIISLIRMKQWRQWKLLRPFKLCNVKKKKVMTTMMTSILIRTHRIIIKMWNKMTNQGGKVQIKCQSRRVQVMITAVINLRKMIIDSWTLMILSREIRRMVALQVSPCQRPMVQMMTIMKTMILSDKI